MGDGVDHRSRGVDQHGVRRDLTEGVLRITIVRPERMNALDDAAAQELIRVLDEDARDEEVRVVVLTGEADAFCTGADIAAMAASPAGTPEDSDALARRTMETAAALVRAIVDLPVPVIASVNGPAVGLGVSLALAADLVYASPDAYFLLAFTNVGLMPDGGSSLLVAAAVGRARANAMALLGERLDARTARDIGLINDVVEASDLDERVAKVARRCARGPRRALELTKNAMNAVTLKLLEDALQRESTGQQELLQAPDFATGVSAILSGTRPRFE